MIYQCFTNFVNSIFSYVDTTRVYNIVIVMIDCYVVLCYNTKPSHYCVVVLLYHWQVACHFPKIKPQEPTAIEPRRPKPNQKRIEIETRPMLDRNPNDRRNQNQHPSKIKSSIQNQNWKRTQNRNEPNRKSTNPSGRGFLEYPLYYSSRWVVLEVSWRRLGGRVEPPPTR